MFNLAATREALGRATAWARSIASEKDGTGSASRVIGLWVAGCCGLALIIFVVIRRDFPNGEQLAGLAKVIGFGSAAYGANAIKTGAGDVSANLPAKPAITVEEAKK